MYYVLPKGTKISFPDTTENRTILLNPEWDDDECVEGFALETTYEIGGLDANGQCFFWDGVGDRNYGGMLLDGSAGVFNIVNK